MEELKRPNRTVRMAERKGYCSHCGDWATNCETIIVFSIPEKVCKDCRESKVKFNRA